MKLLFVIPHYFKPTPGNVQNNSLRAAARGNRVAALAETIASLHRLYGQMVCGIDHSRGVAFQAVPVPRHEVDVIVCTLGDDHLLNELPLSQTLYRQAKAVCPPEMLGFAAHQVMGLVTERYDYYCYLEDDIGMVDPLFFVKRRLFDDAFGDQTLLQPNRYEVQNNVCAFKTYVDYALHEVRTAAYQDLADRPRLEMPFLAETIRFERPSYPAAGSFFLNARQFERWRTSPAFHDHDVSFIGPLDSASTLSIMKTFRVYKPVLDHGWFLEVTHLSPRWADTVGKEVPLSLRDAPFAELPEMVPPAAAS
jgi:hypothetical protein